MQVAPMPADCCARATNTGATAVALRALRWKSMKIRRLRFSGPIVVVNVSGAVGGDRVPRSRRSPRAPRFQSSFGLTGTTTCTPLPARGLDERRQPHRLELAAHVQRRLDHLAPGDALARVEVEDDAVGLLEARAQRTPRCGTRPPRTAPAPGSPCASSTRDVGPRLAVGVAVSKRRDAPPACR